MPAREQLLLDGSAWIERARCAKCGAWIDDFIGRAMDLETRRWLCIPCYNVRLRGDETSKLETSAEVVEVVPPSGLDA